MITYKNLALHWSRGFRNGNWRRLGFLDRAFFRAALWYARMKGGIVNSVILEKLGEILDRLRDTVGRRILKNGRERAKEMMLTLNERDVFKWAPKLKIWLRDPKYIFWLGLYQQDGWLRVS